MENGLKNVMEDIVLRKIEEIMPAMNCCTCQDCVLDVASYALNRLPPKYVVSHTGEIWSKLSTMDCGQYETDVTTNVVRGIQVIKDHPHHAKEEQRSMNKEEWEELFKKHR